jgi:ATP-binding cassette subfamily F protein 3
MYEPERLGETEVWQRKYAEVMEGLDRAETLWVAAVERLDRAQAAE